MNLGEILTIVLSAGALSAVVSLLMVPAQRRKIVGEGRLSEADAAAKLSATSIALLQPAREEIARLQKDLAMAHENVSSLRIRMDNLSSEVGRLTKDLTFANAEIGRLRSSTI